MRRPLHQIAIGVLACSLVGLVGTVTAPAAAASQEKLHKVEILSKAHTLEEAITSMHGPTDTQFFELANNPDPELLWLKSTRVDIVDQGGDALSAEYLCHSNLYFTNFGEHQQNFSSKVTSNQKFVDVNQGQLEIRMPEGFGIPMLSNESLRFHSMVINPTTKSEPFVTRVKTTFEYLRDAELAGPIKAISQRAIRLRVPVAPAKGHEGHATSSQEAHSGHNSSDGLQCDPEQETYEEEPLATSATKNIFKTDPDGPIWSVHWVVPPGRHEYRYKFDNGMRMPFQESIVHMITTHVHPYAVSVELHDLTTGERVFHAEIETFPGGPGIAKIPHYSSVEGMSVYKDHQYEIAAVYDNTTSENIDAMALLYLYYWDRNFTRPADLASR